MLRMKKIALILIIQFVFITFSSTPSFACAVYESYTFSNSKGVISVVSSPAPYLPSKILDSESLGVSLITPQDLFRDNAGNYYLVDSGTNAVYIFNEKWEIKEVVDSFYNDGNTDNFNKPQGVYLNNSGHLYIADTENRRIVVLDDNRDLVDIIDRPESDILPDDFIFYPRKVVSDNSGRIFVVARGVYEGLMEFYSDGEFSGFVGSIPVKVNPIDLFWKSVMSQAQRERMIQFIPVDYTNIFLDGLGFLYTVSMSENNITPIRRLNPSGVDVLIRNPVVDVPIQGDYILDHLASIEGPSTFVDIVADENGIYSALDAKRGRIFSYDMDGNLLFVFGGPATFQVGTFILPVAIETDGDNLYVLDQALARITVFEPTEFAKSVRRGVIEYQTGNYGESIETWNEVIRQNVNFDLAYSKIGRIHFRQKSYKEAMDYFKLGNDKPNYSNAFFRYRQELLREYFGIAMSVIAFLIILIIIIRKRFKAENSKKLHGGPDL